MEPDDLSIGDSVANSGATSEAGNPLDMNEEDKKFIAEDDSSEDVDYKEGDEGFGHEDSAPDHSIDSKDVDVAKARSSSKKSKDGKKKSKKDKKDRKEKKSKKDKHKKSHRDKEEKKTEEQPVNEDEPAQPSASKKRRLKKGADIETLEAEVKSGEQKR